MQQWQNQNGGLYDLQPEALCHGQVPEWRGILARVKRRLVADLWEC